MIDLALEEVFLLSDGPRKVRRSRGTLYRLINQGRPSLSGKVVKLDSVQLEGGIATSVEALMRFRESLNDTKEITDE